MEESKVVAIAGASSGIGEACARLFARKGYRVSICARREQLLHEIVGSIREEGGKAIAVRADMSRWDDARRFILTTKDNFGRIDVLFNNAGAGIRYTDFENLTVDEIEEGINVNLKTVLFGCLAVIPVMREQGKGHIINTTSILGKRARAGLSVYTAAKHAVDGFSRSLMNEVKKHGIKVSILGPAMVNTEWARKAGIQAPFAKTMLEPEDVAKAVEFLVETPEYYSVWSIDLMALGQTIDPL